MEVIYWINFQHSKINLLIQNGEAPKNIIGADHNTSFKVNQEDIFSYALQSADTDTFSAIIYM